MMFNFRLMVCIRFQAFLFLEGFASLERGFSIEDLARFEGEGGLEARGPIAPHFQEAAMS